MLHAFDASGAFIGSACQAGGVHAGPARLRQRRADLAVDRRARGDGDLGSGGNGGGGGGGGGRDMGRAPFVTQTSGVTTTLYQPWAAGNGVVYIVGAGGVILKTTDSGATWNKQNERHDAGPRGGVGRRADRTSASPALRGTILHTTNGGTSWSNMSQRHQRLL